MGRGILVASPQLLVAVCMEGPPRLIAVTQNGVPRDARVVETKLSEAWGLQIVIESASLRTAPGGELPILPMPVLAIVPEPV